MHWLSFPLPPNNKTRRNQRFVMYYIYSEYIDSKVLHDFYHRDKVKHLLTIFSWFVPNDRGESPKIRSYQWCTDYPNHRGHNFNRNKFLWDDFVGQLNFSCWLMLDPHNFKVANTDSCYYCILLLLTSHLHWLSLSLSSLLYHWLSLSLSLSLSLPLLLFLYIIIYILTLLYIIIVTIA